MHPQPRVRNRIKHTSVVTTGSPDSARHSPRNGFNGFLRALLGDHAVLPPSSCEYGFVQARLGRLASADLTPALERQNHTTSPSASASFVRHAVRLLTGLVRLPCITSRAQRCRVHRIPF